MSLPDDLASLPKPAVIKEVSSSVILDRKITTLQQLYDANGLPYTVSKTAYDPAIIQLETSALDETLLRQDINEVARARLLAFAEGSDLDHLAAFYDVSRLLDESDDRLKKRVILAIQGRSTGGTEARYKFIAMTADLRVSDAIVYTVGRSPVIYIAIFSTSVDGVTSADLIEAVDAALQAADARMINDTVVVRTAVRTVINIAADVWLLPDASLDVLAAAKMALVSAWAATQAMGRDFAQSWWTARLMIDGIHRLVPLTPVGDITVPPDEAVALGTITLNYRGRDY